MSGYRDGNVTFLPNAGFYIDLPKLIDRRLSFLRFTLFQYVYVRFATVFYNSLFGQCG